MPPLRQILRPSRSGRSQSPTHLAPSSQNGSTLAIRTRVAPSRIRKLKTLPSTSWASRAQNQVEREGAGLARPPLVIGTVQREERNDGFEIAALLVLELVS